MLERRGRGEPESGDSSERQARWRLLERLTDGDRLCGALEHLVGLRSKGGELGERQPGERSQLSTRLLKLDQSLRGPGLVFLFCLGEAMGLVPGLSGGMSGSVPLPPKSEWVRRM